MRKILLLALFFVTSATAFGQDFSNKGKDFWVGYGYHERMGQANGGSQDMVLYFATDQVTNITINIPANGYTQNITTGAGNNVVTSATIPKTGLQDARLVNGGLSNNGIHITSDKPMVAYAHNYNTSVSGACILYPTNTLGREYYSVNYKNWSNTNNANAWFYVVAVDTGTTTIEITPTADQLGVVTTPSSGGWTTGVTYTVNLTQGQIYNVMGILTTAANPFKGVDLTGSKIKSINNGTGCKKIGVFSGSGRISITCNANSSSSDNYMVQAMPKNAWGKKYLTVQANGNQSNNIYRVCVTNPATVVKINGLVTALPLQNNFYYEIPATAQPQLIESDSAIMVAQYFTSQGACGNGGSPGDPEVIYLSPVEQNINKVIWYATPNFAITTHSLNVVIPNTGTALSSFRLNNATTTGWVTHPQDPGYSYLRISVPVGFNIIQSDSGFNATAYGFGAAESYGYNAGTNIKDLYQQIGVQTTYGIETTPSVCTNSPFKFKVSLPYIPDSMRWNFNGAAGMLPNNNTVYVNNIPNTEDSSTLVNGRVIHWYSIPLQYTFTTVGTYPITIKTFVPNGECGSVQDIDFDLGVSNPPVAGYTWTPGGCVADSFRFMETTPQFPKATYKFWWNFGDPGSGVNNDTSNLRNPVHLFSAPGTYTVRYASITTPGCLSDTISQTVLVPDNPFATIAGTTAVCVNATPPTITFTGTDGTPGYTFTYTINGGAPQTVSTIGTATTATVTVPTTTAGVFTYNLIGVKNTGSTVCTRSITGQSAVVTVNPLPTANISGTISVCQNAPSPNITFTGASGTAPYTFTYNINGGGNVTVTTVAGNSVTVAAPTNVPGTFTYNLVSVVDASSTLCTQAQGGSAVVTVNPLPTAFIAGTTSVCKNAASPLITFTGAAGTAPYTFTYNINGGANQTITTIAGNSVTIAAPTNVVGTFTYNLVSVLDASSTLCTQAQSGSAIVIVNDLPTASIAGNITVCLNAPSPNITFTGANTTAPYTFSYTINGGPVQTITTVAGNSVTVAVPTNVAGTFTYALVSVQDGSSTVCSQAQSGSAVVTVNPLPTAAIAGNTTVCKNAPSPLVTFTGAVGTAPYTFTYNINGGANQTVSTVAGNSVTVPAPTNVVGVFNYNLVSVQEGSPNACNQAQSGTVVVTVNELPTATISGNTEVCLNAPSPLITFTGASTLAPYTFTYTINGGPNQTVATVAGNSVTVSVPTNVAGTFTYALVSVQDGSSTTCIQAQSGSAVVTVHPLPTANFNYAAPSCETRTVSFTDVSAPNVGTLTNWDWNFGDPASGGNNTSTTQNPTHTFAAAGPYTVTLIVTSSKGCSNLPFTRTVNIDNRPLAGFIIPEVCLSDTYAQFIDTSKLTNSVIDRWDWNFGDPFATIPNPNTSNLQNPTHSYTAVGTYNVRLIVWNFAKGCRDTITQVLQVNGSFPVANFSVNNPATLCANDSVAIVEASTVFPGNITKIEIYWDNVNFPGVFQLDNTPFTGKVYTHLYPNFQAPLTKVFQIRYRAYSGGVCVNDKLANITVNAAPLVQFNNMPNSCLLVPPFQITQASEIGGVPGSGTYSGPGVSPTGMFNPQTAGIGTHTILYTFTSTAAGCVDTMSNTITVLDTAHAAFTFVLPSCEQVPISFTDISTAPASVTLANTVWNFGDATPIENHPPGSTFTHTFALPGTYNVTMHNVSAAGCLSTDTVASITIDPNHGISLLSANNNQTLCVNNAIAPISYQLSGGATNIIMPPSGLPPGVTASLGAGNVITLTGTPTLAGTYNYSIQTTGNTCVVANATGVITVKPDHVITWNASSGNENQTLCVNVPIQDIEYQLSGGATNIVMPPAGLPPGVTASLGAGNVITLTGTPTLAGTYNYSIQTTGNTCVVANATGVITVKPDHVITWNATSGNENQTLCVNVPIQDIKYQLGGGATNIIMPPTGLPPGVNASLGAGNVITLTGAPTLAGTYNYSIQTTGNTCVVANASGVITVDPDHTISHIITSGDTAQSVCVNTAIDDIQYDLGGGATSVTLPIPGLPPGVAGSVSGNILTISGTPTSSAGSPYNFTIQTTGNGCVKATTIGDIKVNPYPVPTFTFDKPSYCIPNATVGFINSTTPTPLSDYTYKWYFGDGDSSQAVFPNHYYTSAGPFNVILKARSTVLLNGGVIGCESSKTNLLDIVHPQPKAGFAKDKPSVCIGGVVTFSDSTTGGGLPQNYFWDMGDGTPIRGGNPNPYTYRDTLPSPFIITYYSQDEFGCNSDTIAKPYYVYPYPAVVDAGPDKSVLEGGSVELEANVFARNPQYSWTPAQFLTDSKILRPRVVNPTTDMTYRLTVTSLGGCQRSNDVFVKLLKFPVIPNTFTPNGDGRNDKWVISFLETYPSCRVQIFTRAGNLIFESRGYAKPWDGTFKGKPMPFDTYYYIIEPGNGRDPITGYVTILK